MIVELDGINSFSPDDKEDGNQLSAGLRLSILVLTNGEGFEYLR